MDASKSSESTRICLSHPHAPQGTHPAESPDGDDRARESLRNLLQGQKLGGFEALHAAHLNSIRPDRRSHTGQIRAWPVSPFSAAAVGYCGKFRAVGGTAVLRKSSDGEVVQPTVTDKYIIKMGKDKKFRAVVAERIGLGFELPKAETVEVVPTVPNSQESEVAVSV